MNDELQPYVTVCNIHPVTERMVYGNALERFEVKAVNVTRHRRRPAIEALAAADVHSLSQSVHQDAPFDAIAVIWLDGKRIPDPSVAPSALVVKFLGFTTVMESEICNSIVVKIEIVMLIYSELDVGAGVN